MEIIKTSKHGKTIINRITKQPIIKSLIHNSRNCQIYNNILKRSSPNVKLISKWEIIKLELQTVQSKQYAYS